MHTPLKAHHIRTDHRLRLPWRRTPATPRVVGLDVARALAIIGMFGAHVGVIDGVAWTRPATWTALVQGRSAILFALLAGVSIALITGGRSPSAAALPVQRLRLTGRGIAVFSIGLVMEMLGTPVVGILCLYGVLFVVAGFFLTLPPARLVTIAALLSLTGPVLTAAAEKLTLGAGGAGTALVLTGPYPITVWLCLLLTGLAVGRLGIDRRAVAVGALLGGLALAVLGYGIGGLAQAGAFGPDIASDVRNASTGQSASVTGASAVANETAEHPEGYAARLSKSEAWHSVVATFVTAAPHSGGTAEIVGSGGFALAVLGLCLLLRPRTEVLFGPLAALGSMPLTAYVVHIVVIFMAQGGPGSGVNLSNAMWGWLTLGMILGCTAWAWTMGRGPLERLVTSVAQQFAGGTSFRAAPRDTFSPSS